MIDLDTMLYPGSDMEPPTWDEVVEYFRDGEFYEEHYEVEAIKKYLRTPEQKAALNDADISIEEMFNGRYTMNHEPLVARIFGEWNTKLGFNKYGF